MTDPRIAPDGHDHAVPIIPVDPAIDAYRSRCCKVVMALLNAGMPVSALAAAGRYGIQFTPKTIHRWARGEIRGDSTRARRTYAVLILGAEVAQ